MGFSRSNSFMCGGPGGAKATHHSYGIPDHCCFGTYAGSIPAPTCMEVTIAEPVKSERIVGR